MGGGATKDLVEGEKIKKLQQYKNDFLKEIKMFSCRIDVEGWADFKNQTVEEIIKQLGDARLSYIDHQRWATTLYNIQLEENSNSKKDGYLIIANQDTPKVPIGIRSLTKNGLTFVQNQYQGRGKGWEFDPIFVFINIGSTMYQLVCDIIDTPQIYYTIIRSSDILFDMFTNKRNKYNRDTYYKTFFDKDLTNLIVDGHFEENIKLPL